MQCETDDAIARMNELMRRHSGPLLRYLTRLTSREHSAEDFVQETMLRAWRHLPSIPGDVVGQHRWLFVVARRLVIGAIRRTDIRPAEVSLVHDVGRDPCSDDTANIAIAGRTLLAAFGDLSVPHGRCSPRSTSTAVPSTRRPSVSRCHSVRSNPGHTMRWQFCAGTLFLVEWA